MKIQLKYLAEEMQAISKGLEKVVQELTASENDGLVSEIFCQVILYSYILMRFLILHYFMNILLSLMYSFLTIL